MTRFQRSRESSSTSFSRSIFSAWILWSMISILPHFRHAPVFSLGALSDGLGCFVDESKFCTWLSFRKLVDNVLACLEKQDRRKIMFAWSCVFRRKFPVEIPFPRRPFKGLNKRCRPVDFFGDVVIADSDSTHPQNETVADRSPVVNRPSYHQRPKKRTRRLLGTPKTARDRASSARFRGGMYLPPTQISPRSMVRI